MPVEEILKMSMVKSQGSKLKLFQEINENHDIAKRNWRLMFLDIHNLSAEHVKKLNMLPILLHQVAIRSDS